MSLTLEDIARKAGVSRATVSRVLNGDKHVRETTRVRVLEVLRAYNFQPNLAARGLAAGRTNVIGLVIPAGVTALFADPYFPLLIQGAMNVCNLRDYSLMLWLAEPEYERRTIRKILHGGLLDGVIVSSALIDDPILHALYESKMPFVLVGRHPVLDVNYVDVDNIGGAREATLHLIRLGHKRIATITGPLNMIAGSDRLQGYRHALEMRNLPYDEALVAEGDFTEEGGYAAMLQLLPKRPTAVFVASDMMAVGALRAISQAGLRVPEDIALVGYDDIPVAVRITPPLTTVRQPINRLGEEAVRILLDVLNSNGQVSAHRHRVLLPVELVIRASCGSPFSNLRGGDA